MKKVLTIPKVLALAVTLLSYSYTHSQLIVENDQSVEWYVQNVLLGSGVTVSNITFNGVAGNTPNNQCGFFDSSNSNVGMPSGLIIGSGDVTGAIGPNNTGSNTVAPDISLSGDPDLQALIPGYSVNHNAILEFDFIPNGDTLRFNFVWASEEYPEWVGSSFNDVFGFFVSGPGITGPYSSPIGFPGGSMNIALIPGTTTPVTIDNVNLGNNAQYYIDNQDGPLSGDPNNIQYDGFTTPMEAFALVQCGELYHIKIAVADAGDTAYDSAVFLEEGSFTSNEAIQATLVLNVGLTDTLLYENCGNGHIQFRRFSNIENTSVVELEVSGVATNGVDYTFIPDEIWFQANDSTADLNISAFPDGILEGFESVKIDITNTQTACGIPVTSEFRFSVADDPEPLGLEVEDKFIDCGDEVQLGGLITGGYGNYDYFWSTGDTDSSIYVSPGYTTDYILLVVDTCNAGQITDTITVNVPVYPPVEVDMDDEVNMICLETQTLAPNSITGGDEVYSYEWVQNGDLLASTYSIDYTAGVTQQVFFTATDQCGNFDTDTILVIVPDIPITIDISPDTAICLDGYATLFAQANGGEPPFSYEWLHDGSTTQQIIVSPDETTTYHLRVIDQCTAFLDAYTTVRVEYVEAVFSVTNTDPYGVVLHNGSDENSYSTSELEYYWDLGAGVAFTSENVTHTFTDFDPHDIVLYVSNDIGCVDTAGYSTIPPAVLYIPNSFSPNGDGKNDTFGAYGSEIKEFEMRIYNRWGQQVFFTDDINNHWRGEGVSNDDYFVETGSYVYIIKGRGTQNERFSYMGSLTVVR